MKFIKTISSIILAMSLFYSTVSAKTPVDVRINGNYINFNNDIYIKDGYTMLPVRALGEILGFDVINWNGKEKKATLSNGSKTVEIYATTKKSYINGKSTLMPVSSDITDNKTYVCARFICEVFDANISWINKTHTVEITKNGINIDKKYIDTSYTKDDLKWLAQIVNAEAQGESEKGKIAVANVVLNRKENKEFPNTIYDVIFDKKYGVQFTPTSNGAIYNDATKDSYSAAKRALFGENVIGNCLYFLNPSIATNFWIINNRQFAMSIGKHDFYL